MAQTISELTHEIEKLSRERSLVVNSDPARWAELRDQSRDLEAQRKELLDARLARSRAPELERSPASGGPMREPQGSRTPAASEPGREWWRWERPGPTTPMSREVSPTRDLEEARQIIARARASLSERAPGAPVVERNREAERFLGRSLTRLDAVMAAQHMRSDTVAMPVITREAEPTMQRGRER